MGWLFDWQNFNYHLAYCFREMIGTTMDAVCSQFFCSLSCLFLFFCLQGGVCVLTILLYLMQWEEGCSKYLHFVNTYIVYYLLINPCFANHFYVKGYRVSVACIEYSVCFVLLENVTRCFLMPRTDLLWWKILNV